MLQLLTHAWDVDGGKILLNGQRLQAYNEATLRQMTAVVSQRVHIFSNTLRENLLFAAPSATDERLGEVLQLVGLTNLLESEGLHAWLGDGAASFPAVNNADWYRPRTTALGTAAAVG